MIARPVGALAREGFIAVGAGLLLVLTFLVLADASLTWLILVLGALGIGALMFWSRSIDDLLLFLFLFTLPIDISKGLIAEGGVYSPGLSLYLSDVVFVPLFVGWVYRGFFLERQPIALQGVQRYALLFVAFLWFSAIMSESLLGGSLAAITHTKYFLMYVLVADMVRSRDRVRLVLAALAASLVLQSLFALAQVATGSPLTIQGLKPTNVGVNLVFEAAGGLHAYRPSGMMQHPNVLADFLTFLLPPGIALVLLARPALMRWGTIAAVLMLAGCAVLVLTLSRGGWIAFTAAMLVLVTIGVRKRMIALSHVLALGGVLLMFLAVVSIVFPAALLRITESDERSSEARWAMMDQALLIIERNPVLGVGYGGYNRAAQNNVPESYAHLSIPFQDQLLKGIVHNKYLLVAGEHGLVGLALFLFLLWKHFRLFFSVRHWRTRLEFALAAGLASAVAAQVVFFLFDHFYNDVRIEMLWVTFGLLVGIVRLQPLIAPNRPAHALAGVARA